MASTPVAGLKLDIEALRNAIMGELQEDGTRLPVIIVPHEESNRNDQHLRRLTHSRICYYNNALTDRLPFGEVESLAIPCDTYTLAYTEGMLANELLGVRFTPDLLIEGGYRDGATLFGESDTDWWIPSGRQLYFSPDQQDAPANRFYLPVGAKTPLGEGQVQQSGSPRDLPGL